MFRLNAEFTGHSIRAHRRQIPTATGVSAALALDTGPFRRRIIHPPEHINGEAE